MLMVVAVRRWITFRYFSPPPLFRFPAKGGILATPLIQSGISRHQRRHHSRNSYLLFQVSGKRFFLRGISLLIIPSFFDIIERLNAATEPGSSFRICSLILCCQSSWSRCSPSQPSIFWKGATTSQDFFPSDREFILFSNHLSSFHLWNIYIYNKLRSWRYIIRGKQCHNNLFVFLQLVDWS